METGFLLVRLQLKYGSVDRFSEIMSHLVPVLEKKGWRLHGAYQTTIGRLWEAWDLWEVPGASGVQSVLVSRPTRRSVHLSIASAGLSPR